MVPIEKREVVDSLAELVWLKRRLPSCQFSQILNTRLAAVP